MTDPTRINVPRCRDDRIALARRLNPHLSSRDRAVAAIEGGPDAARKRIRTIDPVAYARTRNHLDGAITRLSPYIRHGVVSLAEVRDAVLSAAANQGEAEKMVQQLAWRDYWQRLHADLGNRIWDDLEDYKTGFQPSDYARDLPDDIARAETGVASMDHCLRQLIQTGWLHNHARLYLAAYVCHFRRVRWQAGAQFFLTHLLDGDPASNNLSWQWVASTFSHKPYYFNLDNLRRFCGPDVDVTDRNNRVFADTYEALHRRLFPRLDPPQPRQKKSERANTSAHRNGAQQTQTVQS